MNLKEIQIRDPFVLPLGEDGDYYLFGTTDKNVWKGPGTGFDCYRSCNLENWEGPIPAFRPKPNFWATTEFWAPEVHAHDGRFFMFATFNAKERNRGTQVMVSDQPGGGYEPWSDGPVTPPGWLCLDGTLHVDETSNPWIVFCHEWLQVRNGAIYAMRLSPDLKQAAGEPMHLFDAAEAPWVRKMDLESEQETAGAVGHVTPAPAYVTDGPFLHRTKNGALLMLWSSFGEKGYAVGIARSETGGVLGPWKQETEPLLNENGGHGMIFRTFDGRLLLTLHQPNKSPNERAIFQELIEEKDIVRVKGTQ